MPLTPLKEMLGDAKKHNYAIGCFNAINLEMIRGIINAAEIEKAPVILCHAEMHFEYTPLETLAPILVREARAARVPVAILLDHGKSFSAILKAIHLGFNAVMFDGSRLPFEENIEKTRQIVKIANALGVTVEAELGHVARPEGGGAEDEGDASYEDKSLHTDPAQAREFAEKTGVDTLAIAFGTAHGLYLSEPELDLIRLAELEQATGLPLVMHGGSGLSNKDFQSSIKLGISKINYYTGMAHLVSSVIKEKLYRTEENVYYHDLMMWSIEAITENIRKVIKVFKSNNRA